MHGDLQQVFYIDVNGAVQDIWWNGSTRSRTQIRNSNAADVAGSVAGLSRMSNGTDVFHPGSNHLLQRQYFNGSWASTQIGIKVMP